MLQLFFHGRLQAHHFRKLGLRLFVVVMALFFFVYTLLRLCLYGEELSLQAEAATVINMLMVAAIISVSAMVLLYLAEAADRLRSRNKR